MCIIITYPEKYFYDNWYVDLFDKDDANVMRQLKQKIKNEEIYYTPGLLTNQNL
jgi:disulfide oxidoreductase YuzD